MDLDELAKKAAATRKMNAMTELTEEELDEVGGGYGDSGHLC